MRAGKGLFVKIIKMLLLAAVFYFLVKNLYSNLDYLQQYSWNINWLQMGFSIVLLLCQFTLMVLVWLYMLRRMGEHLSFIQAWRIWFLSNLGRYIPGKIWQIAGLVWLAGEEGVSMRIAGASVIIAQALSILASSIMFILLVVYGFDLPSIGLLWPVAMIFVVICAVVYPGNLERILNAGLRIFGKQPVEVRLTVTEIINIFVVYIFGWAIYGMAFYVFVDSLVNLEARHILFTVSIFAVSYVTGLLAFFAPGGIGVREGIIAVFLSQIVPSSLAVGIAVFARVWSIFAEVLCVIPAFLTVRGIHEEKTSKSTG